MLQISVPCRSEVPVNYQYIACLPLGVNKEMGTVRIGLCPQRPPAAPLTKQSLQNTFVISTMDQLDHDAGLQGAPRELFMCPPRNQPLLGFSSLEVPAVNMYQTNGGTNEILTPSLEPINEGASTSPVATRCMADFLPIFASRIRYGCVEYVSRDVSSHPIPISPGSVRP